VIPSGMKYSSADPIQHRQTIEPLRRPYVIRPFYAIGFTLLIAGLAHAAVLLHIVAHCVAVGVIVLARLDFSGVRATRQRDSAKL
jgi:hypothetical protein